MELYIKTIGDPKFNPTEIQTKNEIEQLITQIETILFTNKGEVLGDIDFGCSLNDMLYMLNANEYFIKREINQQISRYCPLASKYQIEAKVSFVRGEVRDEAYIDIVIDSKYMVSITG
jgi:phage baseplate assembly protein W